MELAKEKIIHILLNGKNTPVEAHTIEALVAHLKLDSRKVALEKNREIVARKEYAATTIKDGDEIEIVEFIGGG